MEGLMAFDAGEHADAIEQSLVNDNEIFGYPANLILRVGDRIGLESDNIAELERLALANNVTIFVWAPEKPTLNDVKGDDLLLVGFLMGVMYAS